MSDKASAIDAKLDMIVELRAKNRLERAKLMKKESSSAQIQLDSALDTIQEEFCDFIKHKSPQGPIVGSPIDTVIYNPPPPPPLSRNPSDQINAIANLYPIGNRPDGHWYIISPIIHAPEICVPSEDWKKSSTRYRSVIYHSCKLLVLLSSVTGRNLPYPITFTERRILIEQGFTPDGGRRNSVPSYDLLTIDTNFKFMQAFRMLNQNALYFGGGRDDALLPNLFAALHPMSSLPSTHKIFNFLEASINESNQSSP